jgi:glucose/arabinose dehydrogenase
LWFDPKTKLLWVGDVGEVTFEELVIARAGKHHGWPWREGYAGQPRSVCKQFPPSSDDCIEPVYVCRHGAAAQGIEGDCQSINGGVIVDSCHWPEPFRGQYFFGDNALGALYSVKVNAARDGVVPSSRTSLGRVDGGIPVSFQVGPDGDLYIAMLPGRIVKIAPKRPVSCK